MKKAKLEECDCHSSRAGINHLQKNYKQWKIEPSSASSSIFQSAVNSQHLGEAEVRQEKLFPRCEYCQSINCVAEGGDCSNSTNMKFYCLSLGCGRNVHHWRRTDHSSVSACLSVLLSVVLIPIIRKRHIIPSIGGSRCADWGNVLFLTGYSECWWHM